MIESITIPAAAALCGVGEPAIRRANREGRIKWACQIWIGGRTMTFLDLNSVRKCYQVKGVMLGGMHTAKVQHANGPEFMLYHLKPILLYNTKLEG